MPSFVDDSLIFCRDVKGIEAVESLLSSEFEMTDMGMAGSYLGIQISQD